MEQGKSNVGTVALAVILTAAIVGGGMYFWQKNAKPQEVVQPNPEVNQAKKTPSESSMNEQKQVDFLRTLKSGDTVAGMTLQSIEPYKKNPPASMDLAWEENLDMKFKGETTVTGNYFYDGSGMHICDLLFEITDPDSLAKIPFGRERFCITNIEVAKKLLNSSKSGTATIVIDEYHSVRYPAEGLPDAKLIKKINE